MNQKTADTMLPSSPFDKLVGQPLIKAFFNTALTEQRIGQAYLFVGPIGSGKTEAAYALAKAVLCPEGGCGNCDECRRVTRQTHPDLHLVEPLGVNGYLAEQIRELIHDAALAPVRSTRKVYVITRADLLRGAPANAFLKTLEEPNPSVSFILMARTRDSVMETLLSRCQILAFRRIPQTEAVELLCSMTNTSEKDARIALAVTGDSPHRALEYLRSSARRNARMMVIEKIERLSDCDDLDILEAVKELLVTLKAPLDDVRIKQEQQLAEGKDYLSKAALSALERRLKRELSNRERELIYEALGVVRSWLRDCLLLRAGQSDELINTDCSYIITQTAQRVQEPALIRALQAVDRAEEQIHYNVSVQLAIEVMMFSIQSELR